MTTLLVPFTLLEAAGLDDEAAALAVRFTRAQRDLDAAEEAVLLLGAAREELLVHLGAATAVAHGVRATAGVDWRSAAARRALEVLVGIVRDTEALVADAQGWVALAGLALDEAARARDAARERRDRTEREIAQALRVLGAA